MATLHSKENIPLTGDIVKKTTVRLQFNEQSFDYDFIIDFESGKSNTLHGWYGDIRNENGQYEEYSKQFKKIDLEKYKDPKFNHFYNIPIDVFEREVKEF